MYLNDKQPALICPFTLMEEEALAWTILLLGRAVFLHPFPLPMPDSLLSLADQGKIQIRSLDQPPEAIKEKDKLLKGIKQYAHNTPGRGFLKYIRGTAEQEETETQEEITGWMKGGSDKEPSAEPPRIDGMILLCLIHEWIMQEGELKANLKIVEEKEKLLGEGWKDDLEEEMVWKPAETMDIKNEGIEIDCPPALMAWRELKNKLVSEPVILFTNQLWVWKEYYELEPEECQSHSIPLPKLEGLSAISLQDPNLTDYLRKIKQGIISPEMNFDKNKAVDDLQKTFLELNLPSGGGYRLLMPHLIPSLNLSPPNQKNPDPLILLIPA